MTKIKINNYIVADPHICHGKPTFKGTRIMVWQVLEMMAQGENARSLRKAFPALNTRHIQAALTYASSLTKENYVIVNTQDAMAA